MLMRSLWLGLSAMAAVGLAGAGEEARRIAFDGNDALKGWTVTGDVTIDLAKAREGKGGALKVGPGAKAVLKLRDKDESGKVELWVYDDCSKPANAKVNHTDPRWGLIQNDGRDFTIGIMYAPYLGGDEGYTSSACDGAKWFGQLFWLHFDRAPAGWHKWTIDFDPEAGIQVLHVGPRRLLRLRGPLDVRE